MVNVSVLLLFVMEITAIALADNQGSGMWHQPHPLRRHQRVCLRLKVPRVRQQMSTMIRGGVNSRIEVAAAAPPPPR